MAVQPDLSQYPSTGDPETDARLAVAYEETRNAMAGNRFYNSRGEAPPPDLEAARGESKSSYSKCTYCGDPNPNHPGRNCPHKATTTIPPAPVSENQHVPQLPDMADEDAVRHHHHHEYVRCTVIHHHHDAGTASPAWFHRGQDHGPAAGPGPPQPVSHRGPLASTSGSPFFGGGFGRRPLTPFELMNPCTCLHREARAATRTRSRSRNDQESTRRFHPVSGPAHDMHQ